MRNAAGGRTPAWPNNDERPELRTLRGRVLRFVLLWFLFGLWIVGLATFIGLWLFSGVCVARSAWSAMQRGSWTEAEPLPVTVQMYLVAMVMYEGFHFVTRESEHLWPAMRRMARYVFLHYPQTSARCSRVHPHGILTCGFSLNGAHHMAFQRAGCRWISAENLFYFPIMRDILHWMEFSSSSKTSMQRIMRTGQNLCLLPGGFEEATLFQRGKHRVYIKKRFGFIKLALQHGYNVYPTYTFGEEYTYHAFPYLQWLRLQLNRFRIPGAIFFGLPLCFFLPRSDVDLITVVGKPLHLPHVEHPSRELVKECHDKYVQALQDLFDTHKGVYAVDPDAKLELF
uniref:Acyltransferase n=1 Tax=Phytophthora ramorum TaxID=164328 RepID=H3GEE6_PHYRM